MFLRVYTIEACAASWRVCATEACAVPVGVYTTGPERHPDVSALQRPVLFLEVSATGPELPCRVCTTEACAVPGVVCHRAWAASCRVCTEETCAVPRGVCHRAWAASWRVCTTEACAVPGGVYTTEPELHSDVSALQRSVLFLEVSTCLIHRDQCILTVERVRFASKNKILSS